MKIGGGAPPIKTPEGWLIITHGNGPQVGNLMIQQDLTSGNIPPMPLDVLVAQTEGSLGYILQDELLNCLRRNRIGKYVVTMITQVRVNRNDPAFGNPTKPVGPAYSAEDAERLMLANPDWHMVEEAGQGFRRIVPSPVPERIIQSDMIRSLVYGGNVVIAAGGGGIPIIKDENDCYVGVEAVIDKDLTSAVLANDVKADLLIILTGVDKVYLHYGTGEQEGLSHLTYSTAKQLLAEGHPCGINLIMFTPGEVVHQLAEPGLVEIAAAPDPCDLFHCVAVLLVGEAQFLDSYVDDGKFGVIEHLVAASTVAGSPGTLIVYQIRRLCPAYLTRQRF